MTTGQGVEGQGGQHIVATISKDIGEDFEREFDLRLRRAGAARDEERPFDKLLLGANAGPSGKSKPSASVFIIQLCPPSKANDRRNGGKGIEVLVSLILLPSFPCLVTVATNHI